MNEVVANDQLEARANEWCDRTAAMPQHALPLAKPLLRASADASWEQSLAMEEFAEPICFTTQDFADGVRTVIKATSSAPERNQSASRSDPEDERAVRSR